MTPFLNINGILSGKTNLDCYGISHSSKPWAPRSASKKRHVDHISQKLRVHSDFKAECQERYHAFTGVANRTLNGSEKICCFFLCCWTFLNLVVSSVPSTDNYSPVVPLTSHFTTEKSGPFYRSFITLLSWSPFLMWCQTKSFSSLSVFFHLFLLNLLAQPGSGCCFYHSLQTCCVSLHKPSREASTDFFWLLPMLCFHNFL